MCVNVYVYAPTQVYVYTHIPYPDGHQASPWGDTARYVTWWSEGAQLGTKKLKLKLKLKWVTRHATRHSGLKLRSWVTRTKKNLKSQRPSVFNIGSDKKRVLLRICPPPGSCSEPSAPCCCLLCEAARGRSRAAPRLMTWCMSRASSMPPAALDLGVNACPMKSVSLRPMCGIYMYIYISTQTRTYTQQHTQALRHARTQRNHAARAHRAPRHLAPHATCHQLLPPTAHAARLPAQLECPDQKSTTTTHTQWP